MVNMKEAIMCRYKNNKICFLSVYKASKIKKGNLKNEKDYNDNSVHIACGCCNSGWIYSNKTTKK